MCIEEEVPIAMVQLAQACAHTLHKAFIGLHRLLKSYMPSKYCAAVWA